MSKTDESGNSGRRALLRDMGSAQETRLGVNMEALQRKETGLCLGSQPALFHCLKYCLKGLLFMLLAVALLHHHHRERFQSLPEHANERGCCLCVCVCVCVRARTRAHIHVRTCSMHHINHHFTRQTSIQSLSYLHLSLSYLHIWKPFLSDGLRFCKDEVESQKTVSSWFCHFLAV